MKIYLTKRGENIAKALKGKKQPQKSKAISEAARNGYLKRNGTFSKEELKIIEQYFNEGYTLDLKTIMKHEFPNKLDSLLRNYCIHNKEWFNTFNFIKFVPTHVQKWPLKKWLQFKEDCKILHYTQIMSIYNFLPRSLFGLAKKFKIDLIGTKDEDNKKMTVIERMILSFLKQNNFIFKKEQVLCLFKSPKNHNKHKYRVDFIVNNNIIIEVNGDYWHVNPRLNYNIDTLSKDQKRNLLNDFEKENWCLNNGFRFYIVWEMDLMINLQKTLDDLKKFILNNDKKKGESYERN